MKDGWKDEFASRLSKVKLKPIQGDFYRAVPETATPYSLEDGPSYRFRNRYNIEGKFGALYFADEAEVCRATLEKRGLLPGRRVPHVLISYGIKVANILDLTDLHTLGQLELQIEDFLKSADWPDAYKIPHEFVQAVYLNGMINGLIVPDATHTGNTLVLYPARLISSQFVSVKSIEAMT